MTRYRARIHKAALWAVLLAGCVSQASAQEKYQFSVKQAVDYALKNSAQVKNALTDIKIQLQSNREITSAALPQINGNVSVTDYLNIPVTLVPAEFTGGPAGTYFPVKFGTKYTGSYGANLSQILFDGQVFVGLQARAASIEYAQQNVAVTEEQIKSNVYKVYYQLVIGKKQIDLLDANIARSERLLHDTKALFENGFQEKLDVDRVNVTLSNLRTEKQKVQNQLQTGYVGLKYLLGMPVKNELELTDTLDQAMLRQNLLSDSVRYEDRKDFQLLQTVEKLNRYNVKRYNMSYIPTLSFNAAYSRNAQRNTFDFFKGGEPWFTTSYIGLQLNVPIFDGFARDARVKTAKLQLEKTRTNIADLKNNIDNQVQSAQLNIATALAAVDEQTKNMTLAEQVYNQTKKKYEQGLGSNLEVTNAETELKNAQNNYFSALYDAIIARIDYLNATGKLP